MIHLAALTTKWEHFLKSWVNFNQVSYCEPRNQQLCCETTSRWWTIVSLLVHNRTTHYLTFQAWNAHVSKGKRSFTYEIGNHGSEVSHEIMDILKTTTFVHKTNSYVNIMVHIIRIDSGKKLVMQMKNMSHSVGYQPVTHVPPIRDFPAVETMYFPKMFGTVQMSLCLRLSLSGCYGLWRCLWARGKLGWKKKVLIFEGATPTFCFSILNNFFPNRFQYVDLHVNPRVVSAIQLYEAQQISSQLQRNQTFTFSLSLSL